MTIYKLSYPTWAKAFEVSSTLVDRIFSACCALILIVLALPFFLCIGLLVLLSDGRPILYRGQRLGLNRKPFNIYKFRTLKRGAQQIIGGQLLSHEHNLAIPFGNFLRDTRLDELPQLFNIVKGDINFIGPRPLRPEVYETLCKDIVGFDRFFSVKPGLLGFSQIFTPHASPKRLRSLIDYRSMNGQPPFGQLRLIAFTVFTVLKKVAVGLVRHAYEDVLRRKILSPHVQKRTLTRMKPKGTQAFLGFQSDGAYECEARLMDIHEGAFRLRCPERISGTDLQVKLQIHVHRPHRFWESRNGNKSRFRHAVCLGQVSQERQDSNGWDYVVSYRPATPLSHYIIHQYFLRRSLASPFTS